MGLIGNKPNQTPTNADLGTMAYEDADYFRGNTEIDTLGTVTIGDIKNSALARSGRATIRPSLLLDFAKSKTLDSRITFTRGGIGTYTGYDGLIKSAASNEARFDHNPITGESLGLLIEEQRTNLLTYSENFDNAIWTKGNSTIIPNAAIAPDGTLTADKYVESTANGAHSTVYVFNAVSGNTYTASYYIKSGERTEAIIGFDPSLGFSTYQYGRFNLVTGVATTFLGSPTLSITAVGNGWYRCSVTATATGTGSNAQVSIQIHNGATNIYTGDGTSGLYIWGAQLEEGAFATSYIPSADSFTSRASTGTFIGSNGLIQSAATNVARYNYNPLNLALSPKLLLEPAATNLLWYSENFDNANWAKMACTISANAITAPDGATTADKLAEDSTSTYHYTGSVPAVTTNSQYCATVYAKAGERKVLYLEFSNNSTFPAARFDLSNGTVIDKANNPIAAGIIPVGNGWYRCWVSTTALSTYLGLYIQTNLDDGSRNYTGVTGNGFYIWGAQLEVGTTATNYIPTTSAQVTRSADVSSSSAATRPADNAVITGTNFSSWYRQDEGAIFAKADYIGLSSVSQVVCSFDNGNNRHILYRTTSKNITTQVDMNSVINAALSSVTVENNTVFNASYVYKLNDIAFSLNGLAVLTDTSAILPYATQLQIGDFASIRTLNGHISKLAYYPKRLSNTELQGLTTT
jgi:hypothetical protein